VSRTVLTTVNRRLVSLALGGVTDVDGDPTTLAIDGVTQDEPVTASGDPTSPDAVDEGDGELRVRAERNPHGDGRVYRIAFTASDDHGGSCSGTATVSVPRKKKKAAVDSAPPSYDSLAH
jgi:Big-like domain-containing protein